MENVSFTETSTFPFVVPLARNDAPMFPIFSINPTKDSPFNTQVLTIHASYRYIALHAKAIPAEL